jgi:hypothetical protein
MYHLENIDGKEKYPMDKLGLKAIEYNTKYFSQVIGCIVKTLLQSSNDCVVFRVRGYSSTTNNTMAIIHEDGVPTIVEIIADRTIQDILLGTNTGRYLLEKVSEKVTIIGEDLVEYPDVLIKDVYKLRAAGTNETAWVFKEWREDLFVQKSELDRINTWVGGKTFYTPNNTVEIFSSSFVRHNYTARIVQFFITGKIVQTIGQGENYIVQVPFTLTEFPIFGAFGLPIHIWCGTNVIYSAWCYCDDVVGFKINIMIHNNVTVGGGDGVNFTINANIIASATT